MDFEENRRVPWPGWKVVRLIGRGGYGSVYEIRRDQYGISERAAMKVVTIPKDSSAVAADRSDGYDDESIKRKYEECLNELIGEYKIMLQLKGNSNIVDCEDIYCEEHTDGIGWDLYIRMELLKPLKDRLSEREFPESEVIRLGRDICRALSVCEEKNIIHRDVKPENIMISDYGYKLGDFGVARSLDHTTNATVTGTERYMAPEIVKREKYGRDVDTYSLGLVLYWLLNDRRMPFWPMGSMPPKMSEVSEAQYKRIHGETLPEPAHGSDQLKRIVRKACAYDRSERYSSAAGMLSDLEGLKTDDGEKTASRSFRGAGDPDTVFPAMQSSPDGSDAAERTGTGWRDDTAKTFGAGQGADAAKTFGPGRGVDAAKTFGADRGGDAAKTFGTGGGDDTAQNPESGWRDAQETMRKPAGEDHFARGNPGKEKSAPTEEETVGRFGADPQDTREPGSRGRNASAFASKEAKETAKKRSRIPVIAALAAAVAVVGLAAAILAPKRSISNSSHKTAAASGMAALKVGDTCKFGTYEQDLITPDEKEDIEWIVLDKDGTKLLLISKYALDCQPYNTGFIDVTWESCSLRKWLNETFLNEAFSAEEADRIVASTVTADGNPDYSVWSAGLDTEDQVFLLSMTEVTKYFSSDQDRMCKLSAYEIQYGTGDTSVGNMYGVNGEWWLRTPGSTQHFAVDVNIQGEVDSVGRGVDKTGFVRPAIWIDTAK